MKQTVTVRVSRETHAKVSRLAELAQCSIAEVLASAVEAYEAKPRFFFAEMDEAYKRLRFDTPAVEAGTEAPASG